MSEPCRGPDGRHKSRLHLFGLDAEAGQLEQDVPRTVHPAVIDLYVEPARKVDIRYEWHDLPQPGEEFALQPVLMAPPVTEQDSCGELSAMPCLANCQSCEILIHLTTSDNFGDPVGVVLIGGEIFNYILWKIGKTCLSWDGREGERPLKRDNSR